MGLILGAIINCIGSAMFVLGLWRMRRGRDPHCARCHHNLTGLVASDRCPECGADLTRDRATRLGAPYRRWRLVIAGTIVLAIGIGTIIVGGYARSNPATVVKWLPDWAVLMNARSTGEYQAPARTELVRRLIAGSLSSGSLTGAVDHALTFQADLSTPWDAYWGEFIETARQAGRVEDEVWAQYLDQAIITTVRARRRVRAVDLLAVELTTDTRFGQLSGDIRYSITAPVPADWEGSLEERRGWMGSSFGPLAGGRGSMRTTIDHDLTDPGAHEFRIGVFIDLLLPPSYESVWETSRRFVVPVEVVEDDPVRPAADSTMTPEQVRARLSVDSVHLRTSLYDDNTTSLSAMARDNAHGTPVRTPLALRAIARVNGEEFDIGSVTIAPGTTSSGWGLSGRLNLPETFGRLDIILRADSEVARETIEIDEYWDGEIIFEDVPFTDERKKE